MPPKAENEITQPVHDYEELILAGRKWEKGRSPDPPSEPAGPRSRRHEVGIDLRCAETERERERERGEKLTFYSITLTQAGRIGKPSARLKQKGVAVLRRR